MLIWMHHKYKSTFWRVNVLLFSWNSLHPALYAIKHWMSQQQLMMKWLHVIPVAIQFLRACWKQITVNSDDGKLLKFTCFNDAHQSLLITTGCTKPVNDIPLQELKRIVLNSGSLTIIADKSTKLIAQFLPLCNKKKLDQSHNVT